MAETAIEVDVLTFWERVERFYDSWKNDATLWNNAGAVVLQVGQPNDDVLYSKSTSIQYWFFGYEFTETIMVFTKSVLFIFTSLKKVQLLERVTKEKDGKLPPVPIELITRKKEDTKNNYQRLVDAILGSENGKTVGTLLKEAQLGDFVNNFTTELTSAGVELVEISNSLSTLLAVKDPKEIKCIRTAATISSHILKSQLLPQVETVIDEEKKMKHTELAEMIEKLFDEPSKISKKLHPDHIDSCYVPLIQSGGKYDLKPGAANNEDFLHFGTIVCSIGAKYKSYCSNVARTYLVDPSKEHERNYKVLLDAHQAVLDNLRSGVKLSKLYQVASKVVESRQPELLENFTRNCGWGIGLEFHESYLTINGKNETVVKPGMVFNISVGFKDLSFVSDDAKKRVYSLLLSDTVLIRDNGDYELLTEKCPKKLSDISYFLETEQREADEPETKKPTKKESNAYSSETATTLVESKFRESTKARAEEKNKMKSAEDKRREHQKMLEERSREEAAARFSKDQPKSSNVRRSATSLEAYKDPSNYPVDADRNKIFFDPQRECVLVPVYGLLVPFLVSNIKNATNDEEYLRLNFNTPDNMNLANNNTEADMVTRLAASIREITYRCPDPKRLSNLLRLIKECRKKVTARETERRQTADLVTQEKLVLSKNRVPRLSDLFVRPNLGGRKTTGALESHVNGFRFTSTKGENIDVMYKNIKHAFFQPAENDLIVLVHFHLHNAIMVGKKKTTDVQFCTEVMEVSQALDSRSRYDADELEDEQRERQMRKRLNTEFQNWVRKVEDQVPDLEFDMPYRDLGFDGVPHRSAVTLIPTVNCLVNLTEQPFFILTVSDVEIASFERVQFSLKNFDLVFVLKDYDVPPVHINAIHIEHLETIKEWLDSRDIKYYEGTQTLNWNRIMSTIREDPVRFHTEEGGWSFLSSEPDQGAGEEESEEESEFEPDSDDDGAGGGDFDSDDGEDDDDDEYGGESDDGSDDWDEDDEEDEDDNWEEKARQEDREAAEKRAKRGRADDYSDDSEEEAKKKKVKVAPKPAAKPSSSKSSSSSSGKPFSSSSKPSSSSSIKPPLKKR